MDFLPAVNATLNAISTVLLLNGHRLIMAKRIPQHRAMMLTAFVVSMLFLVGYVIHKALLYQSTGSFNTTFGGQGAIRGVYLVLLISHVLLAMTVPVLASITLFRGLRMNVAQHRRIARITYPIWLYVSVTGVLVYFMLYQWFPSS
jgi:uncharacterized membrane protein YozB (DUF420 family)